VFRTVLRATLIFIAGALLLSGCGGGGLFSGPKVAPDEFAVVSRAPLTLPPDYGLRPPRRGAKRPNEVTPRQEARKTLFGNAGKVSGGRRVAAPKGADANGLTPGEQAFLKQAGALNVDSEIRYVIERESGRVKEEDSLVDTLVFWRDKKPANTVVDPVGEAKRLRDNAALGKPPTEGRTLTKQAK
jgi:hypothetical protein